MKKVIRFLIPICILFLILLMIKEEAIIRKAVEKNAGPDFSLAIMKITIWGILMGILIEWKTIFNIFRKQFSVNWVTLFTSLFLIVILLIPIFNWVYWFGVNSDGIYLFLPAIKAEFIRGALSVVAGTLFIKSFKHIK